MPEAYLRGNTIKYLRFSDEVFEKAKQIDLRRDERLPAGRGRGRGRGGPGGRGDGGGRGEGRGRGERGRGGGRY